MCIITYIPISTEAFVFTQNRDEALKRPAPRFPVFQKSEKENQIFAQDPEGGGTWMMAGKHTTIGLMNGGFKPHQPNPPYRHSRGLIPLKAAKENHPLDFYSMDSLNNIEPFTCVIKFHRELHKVVWTGKEIFKEELDGNHPHIFFSNQLYPQKAQFEKLDHWERFLSSQISPSPENILDFHKSIRLIKHPYPVACTAITQLTKKKTTPSFSYLPLPFKGKPLSSSL